MNLSEYRRSGTHLADFLPWAALVDEGIVLNKDGSFQRTARFRGPDLDSSVPAELVAVAGRLNNALRRLGSGWAVFVEAQRYQSNAYPPSSCPDVASALVDAERRAQFEEEGAHYESAYFLTFLYLPPAEDAARVERLLYEGRERGQAADSHEAVRGFVDKLQRVADGVGVPPWLLMVRVTRDILWPRETAFVLQMAKDSVTLHKDLFALQKLFAAEM